MLITTKVIMMLTADDTTTHGRINLERVKIVYNDINKLMNNYKGILAYKDTIQAVYVFFCHHLRSNMCCLKCWHLFQTADIFKLCYCVVSTVVLRFFSCVCAYLYWSPTDIGVSQIHRYRCWSCPICANIVYKDLHIAFDVSRPFT